MWRWVKHRSFAVSVALMITALGSVAFAHTSNRGPSSADLVNLTEVALVDQIACRQTPKVSLAINAMLGNKLIRYVADESGVYLFSPTRRLSLFGLPVKHISGFDYEAFNRVPVSTMAGSAPPVFLEVDVEAPVGELRKRALEAGLVEALTRHQRPGFEVSSEGWGSYLANNRSGVTSSIRCVAF